jgi:hypothetical protein
MSDIDYPELSKEDLCLLLAARDKELDEWRKLHDAAVLHQNLMCGFPAKLDKSLFLHLAGATDYQHISQELEQTRALLARIRRYLISVSPQTVEVRDLLHSVEQYQ